MPNKRNAVSRVTASSKSLGITSELQGFLNTLYVLDDRLSKYYGVDFKLMGNHQIYMLRELKIIDIDIYLHLGDSYHFVSYIFGI